jgi:hypothetical protein
LATAVNAKCGFVIGIRAGGVSENAIARPLYAVRVFPRIDPISFARDNAKKEVSYEK